MSNSSKELMQEAVSEFVCFVTSEARDICIDDGRRAISVQDLVDALETLGGSKSRPTAPPTLDPSNSQAVTPAARLPPHLDPTH